MTLLLALLACTPKSPAPAPAAEPEPVERPAPRLAVYLVVDQLPVELFERIRPHATGGFARLTDPSARVGVARYAHAVAYTCPGHATLATGASPRVHGIIGNNWVVDGETFYCGDIDNLRSEGLSDRVKAAGGTVASFSLKDRAALMLGGRSPDAIAWYDKKTGSWCERAPEWLDSAPIIAALEQPWEARRPELYAEHHEDAQPWEEDVPVLGTTFPHPAPGADHPELFPTLPASGTVLTDAAIEALDALELGADDTPDLLAVSYSQTDYIGHAWTAQSWEAMDGLLALDADLERLFAALDEKVGADNWVVALTSDHGVASGESRRVDVAETVEAATEALHAAGVEGDLAFGDSNIYLPASEDQAVRDAAVRAVAGVFDEADGFAGAWGWRLDGLPEDLPQREAIEAAIDPARSGDIYFLLEEGVLLGVGGSEKQGTNHGTPYAYDTEVPLLLRGPGLRPGAAETVDTRKIAPTLAAWIGVEPPADATLPPIEGALSEASD